MLLESFPTAIIVRGFSELESIPIDTKCGIVGNVTWSTAKIQLSEKFSQVRWVPPASSQQRQS